MRAISGIIATVALLAVVGCGPKAPKETAPTVDERNTNYKPGAGVLGNVARAGKRTGVMSDYEQLKTIIFAMELENNRMPSKEDIRTELTRNGKNLLKLIDEGAILLPATIQKDGLWFYEVDADKAGGIVVVAGNVSRATADDAKKLIGQQ